MVEDWVRVARDAGNPAAVTLDELRRMVRMSGTCRFPYDYLRFNIVRRVGRYRNGARPEVQRWVTERVMPAAMAAAPELLSALHYGNVLAEPVWRTVDGELELQRIKVADPEDWWHGRPERNETGEVAAWLTPGGKRWELYGPAGVRQVIQWAFGSEFGNAWGDGMGQRAYGHDLYLRKLYQWEGVGAETAALKRLVAFYHGDDQVGQQLAEDVAQLGVRMTVAVPEETCARIEAIGGDFSGSSPFNDPVRRHRRGVFAAYYQPDLMADDAKYGSRGRAETQLEAYLGVETSLTEQFVDQVLLSQVVATGVRLRFGGDTPLGDVPVRDASPPDREAWARIVQALASVGVFDPDDAAQARWAGELFELPGRHQD